VAQVRAAGRPLDGAAYAKLGHASVPAVAAAPFAGPQIPPGVAWFSRVEPGLFHAVMHRYMSGQPLPAAAQPGSPAYTGAWHLQWKPAAMPGMGGSGHGLSANPHHPSPHTTGAH
jgi:hypothetical protein